MRPEKEPAVLYQPARYQPYALKSGGSFARPADNYAQRQPRVFHKCLRLVFLFSPLQALKGENHGSENQTKLTPFAIHN